MDVTQQVQSLLNGASDRWKEQLSQRDEQIESLRKDFFENQKGIDDLIKSGQARTSFSNKTFSSVWNDTTNQIWQSKQAELNAFKTDRDAKLKFEIKTVGNMLSSTNLTGDGVVSYGQRQGLVPNDQVNFRDLIPSSKSPTGIYATFRETGSEGSISVQTEGQQKTQIDYDFTEVKVVSDYIAGYATISKQMLYHLPFVQGALTRMLLRDFYKKENTTFYGLAYTAATGNPVPSTSSVNDAEELLDLIGNQRKANFNASFVLISWADHVHLLKTGRNANSGYGVPGGIIYDNSGNMQIAGAPIIPASWVTTGEPLIVDRDFIERVETESLRVEFSYEDDDNFRRNMVTVRCECFEDLNFLRTEALIAGEFGGS